MNQLSGLQPQKVFAFFEELCGIPHGSYHVDAISDHLAEFAASRGLRYVQDEEKNVIIYLDATPGYEDAPTLILQGHMDMVAVSDDGRDMTKTALDVTHDDDWVYAEGTSLGGDDGIAVAYMMAIADDAAQPEGPAIPHPSLDLLITTNEEVGMDGAMGLDASLLRGRRMVNLDSEDEGVFTVGCAGGQKITVNCDLAREADPLHAMPGAEGADVIEVSVAGGLGGHSGQMIHLGRANACLLLARILRRLSGESGALLMEIEGGTAANAIPSEARMRVLAPRFGSEDGPRATAADVLAREQEEIRREYLGKDDGIVIRCETLRTAVEGDSAYTNASTLRLAKLLLAEPDGVIAMSGATDKPLVQTSLNLGVLRLEAAELEEGAEVVAEMSTEAATSAGQAAEVVESAEEAAESAGQEGATHEAGAPIGRVRAVYELRSMLMSSLAVLSRRVIDIAKQYGATLSYQGPYPAWEYREVSPLREQMVRVWTDMHGSAPIVEVIHAGLECGLLAEKIEGFDAVSIGPDMRDIHTTGERLSIKSVGSTWEFLLAVLRDKG